MEISATASVRSKARAAKDAEPTQLELYTIYRSYIEHEDGLINNRVSWFIQLHAFLIGSYSLVTAAIIKTFFEAFQPSPTTLLIRLIATAPLAGIAIIGLASSASARGSVDGANDAIVSLCHQWDEICMERGGTGSLPALICGRKTNVDENGASLHRRLPKLLGWVWWLSLTIPAALLLLAWFGPGHARP